MYYYFPHYNSYIINHCITIFNSIIHFNGIITLVQIEPNAVKLLDIVLSCYNLTIKNFCVQFLPLRFGQGSHASVGGVQYIINSLCREMAETQRFYSCYSIYTIMHFCLRVTGKLSCGQETTGSNLGNTLWQKFKVRLLTIDLYGRILPRPCT